MPSGLDPDALDAVANESLDWRFKGIPSSWWGHTPAEICREPQELFGAGAVGPVCVLSAQAIEHNLTTMAQWCRRHAVDLAPHGKTHMSPQLMQRQLSAGACAVTLANISQVRVFRAFRVRDVVLANELVDVAGLAWLAQELDRDPHFNFVCWVDSVAGVELMSAALARAGAVRPVDVCVEVGWAGGRTGCRGADAVNEVARAAAASARLRLVGIAGYEGALVSDVTGEALAAVGEYLSELRAAVVRLAGEFETDHVIVTAGGSSYFDVVADVLAGDWPTGLSVRTIARSGCYLTHDDGLYSRTSPFGRGTAGELLPALSVWAQVMSRPEPDLALLTMGRRDVSFDQDMPVPYGFPASRVTALNDQHAFLRVAPTDQADAEIGSWVRFGISHPCTVFDKWPLIPLLDNDNRVVDLIRTYF
jgi:D-serine deaminase-like pyridoxal phosphate-dependent protein